MKTPLILLFLIVRISFAQNIEGVGGPFKIDIKQHDSKVKSNYALIIANDSFQDSRFTKLNNPVLDATTIAKLLNEGFGFETEILTNIKKDDFILKLRQYATRQYQKYDQLMIYFAGHGDFDPVLGQGYVIFNDSKFGDLTYSSHLSFSYLQDVLSKINCPHVLLTLDVCYGGTFDSYFANQDDDLKRGDDLSRGSNALRTSATFNAFIYEKLKPKTRLYLSSGGKEVVSDGQKGQHSPFAKAFIQKLLEASRSEYKLLTILELKAFLEKELRTVKMGSFLGNQSNSDFLFVANQ